jgi:hypothetical protein
MENSYSPDLVLDTGAESHHLCPPPPMLLLYN